jgi:8-oxo-dGTP pyrophosphatase MutT (NUDIX family)
MPFEKSAGAVIFRKEKNKIYYLLLHYPSGAKAPKEYWDFAKGHIEKGEKELETVKREVQEETGLEDLEFIKDFEESIYYFFKNKGKTIFKVVNFYLAQTKKKEVKISFEHINFKWLPFKGALSQLTFDNAKEILTKANNFLRENE